MIKTEPGEVDGVDTDVIQYYDSGVPMCRSTGFRPVSEASAMTLGNDMFHAGGWNEDKDPIIVMRDELAAVQYVIPQFRFGFCSFEQHRATGLSYLRMHFRTCTHHAAMHDVVHSELFGTICTTI